MSENQKVSKGKGGYRLIEIETTLDSIEHDCQKGEPTGTLSNDLVKDKIKIVANSDLTEVFGWFANFAFKRTRQQDFKEKKKSLTKIKAETQTQSALSFSDFSYLHKNLVKTEFFKDTIQVSTPFCLKANKYTFQKRGNFVNSMILPLNLVEGQVDTGTRHLLYLGKDNRGMFVEDLNGENESWVEGLDGARTTTDIFEISEYVFKYPYIYFVKGGIHLYIYNVYEPNNPSYYDLEDRNERFICFVSDNNEVGMGIQFLTEKTISEEEAEANAIFNKKIQNPKNYKTLVQPGEFIFLNKIDQNFFEDPNTFQVKQSCHGLFSEEMGEPAPIVKASLLNISIDDTYKKFGICFQTKERIFIRAFLNSTKVDISDKFLFPSKMIQLGEQDIFYCNNEGRQIRIMNLTAGREMEDGQKVLFEGMGERCYIFEKYSHNQIIYVDDSSILRLFQFDAFTRSLTLHSTYSLDVNYNEVFGKRLPFEGVGITNKIIYTKTKAYCFYNANERNEYLPQRPQRINIPSCTVAGPIFDKNSMRFLSITVSPDNNSYSVVIFPTLESHKIPLLDERWAKEPNPIRYIANKQGHILYKICNKFFMFQKNGALLCEVKVEDDDDQSTMEFKALSPNGRFLVYEIKSEKLLKQRTKDDPQDVVEDNESPSPRGGDMTPKKSASGAERKKTNVLTKRTTEGGRGTLPIIKEEKQAKKDEQAEPEEIPEERPEDMDFDEYFEGGENELKVKKRPPKLKDMRPSGSNQDLNLDLPTFGQYHAASSESPSNDQRALKGHRIAQTQKMTRNFSSSPTLRERAGSGKNIGSFVLSDNSQYRLPFAVKVVWLCQDAKDFEKPLEGDNVTYSFKQMDDDINRTFDLEDNFLLNFVDEIPLQWTYKVSNMGDLHTFVQGLGKPNENELDKLLAEPDQNGNIPQVAYFFNDQDQTAQIMNKFYYLQQPNLRISQIMKIKFYFQHNFLFMHHPNDDGNHEIEAIFLGSPDQPHKKGSAAWSDAMVINLSIPQSWNFGQIIRTDEEGIIVFSLHSNKPATTNFIMWDLNNNIEVSSYEAVGGNFACFYSVDASKNFTITKGGALVSLYDGLKLDFWDTECPRNDQVPLNEDSTVMLGPVVGNKRQFVLAGEYMNSIYIPQSIYELHYFEQLIKSMSDPYMNLQLAFFDTSMLHCITREGCNIFHIFAMNPKFLEKLMDNIMLNKEDKLAKNIVVQICDKNSAGKTPFDIVVDNKQAKSVQLMLQMLNMKPLARFSKMIGPHIDALFRMEIAELLQYLENGYFTNKIMSGIEKLEWTWKKEEIYLEHNSSFLDAKWLSQIGRVKFDLEAEDEQENLRTPEQSVDDDRLEPLEGSQVDEPGSPLGPIEEDKESDEDESQYANEVGKSKQTRILSRNLREKLLAKREKVINEKTDFKQLPKWEVDMMDQDAVQYYQNMKKELYMELHGENYEGDNQQNDQNTGALGTLINENKSSMRRVDVQAIEFDWFFKGQRGQFFITMLAKTHNLEYFLIPTIKASIEFQWQKIQPLIVWRIFVPYLVYTGLFLFLTLYLLEIKENELKDKMSFTGNWENACYRVDALIIITILYFLYMEFMQIKVQKLDHFKSFWSWSYLLGISLSGAVCIMDFAGSSITSIRPVASIAILLNWLRFFYYLRLFEATQSLIRMIIEMFIDMETFSFLLFTTVFAFSNVFMLLGQNSQADLRIQEVEEGLEVGELKAFWGETIFETFVFTYRTGLGDFQTDDFGTRDEVLIWIFFVACSFIILVVMLNMLISIMGDTFDKVSEQMEQSRYKEICQMISDLGFVFNRDSQFRSTKYIIVVNLEKVDKLSGGGWEGKINYLKNHIDMKIQQFDKKIISKQKLIRDDLQIVKKGIDSQLTEIRTDLRVLKRKDA